MAAGRIGSNPPPSLSPAALPKGEATETAKETRQSSSPLLATALAGKDQVDNDQAQAGAVSGSNADFGVQISSGGKSRAEAHKRAQTIAKNTPDVREDKVADIKKRIAEGSYQVDSGKIADGMMHEAIREHLAEAER